MPTVKSSRTRASVDPDEMAGCTSFSPYRCTRPNRANPMASTRLDLPDPVGPVKANKSASSKSTTARSRKAVKPSTSSRLGRTGLLQQLGEQPGQPRVVDVTLGQVVAEEVVRRATRAPDPLILVAEARVRSIGGLDHHLDGVREEGPHIVSQPRPG